MKNNTGMKKHINEKIQNVNSKSIMSSKTTQGDRGGLDI